MDTEGYIKGFQAKECLLSGWMEVYLGVIVD